MNKTINRKYKEKRKLFKAELYERAKNNNVIPMMIIETYTASQHRTHIMEIWGLLGLNYKEAYKDYCDKLMGKHLTGRDEIFKSLYFTERDLYEKYIMEIPECMAMGDALAVAYRVLKENEN